MQHQSDICLLLKPILPVSFWRDEDEMNNLLPHIMQLFQPLPKEIPLSIPNLLAYSLFKLWGGPVRSIQGCSIPLHSHSPYVPLLPSTFPSSHKWSFQGKCSLLPCKNLISLRRFCGGVGRVSLLEGCTSHRLARCLKTAGWGWSTGNSKRWSKASKDCCHL